MISTGGSDLEIAINPSIVLWNPYNKPMRVENLYAYVPLSRDDENFGLKVRVLDFDPREYDLFRKWWMYVSAKPKPRFVLPDDPTMMSKDYQKPLELRS